MMLRLLFAVMLLPVASTISIAQAVELRGTIRNNVSHQPVSGVVITLFDSANTILGRLLTSPRGQYRVPMADAVKHIRVQRLGFKLREVKVPLVNDGVEQLDVDIEAIPSLLDPIRVVADTRCSRRSDNDRAQALLQQARAGLLTVVVARDSYPGTVVRLRYKRAVTNGNRILGQEVRIDSSVKTAISFSSVRTGADLVRLGFRDDSSTELLGPDADVLLDDGFAAGYCFRILEADMARAGQIGLGFAPADRRKGRVDIDGALWIDTVARKLIDIEYHFAGLGDADVTRPGGRTSFHEMPNGLVLVDTWSILAPAVHLRISAEALGVDTTRTYSRNDQVETGGYVVSASWADGSTWRAPLGTVRLHTETADQRAATGTVLSLSNTDYRGVLDSSGTLVIGSLLPGPYTVSATDPRFPEVELGPTPPMRFVAVRDSISSITLVVSTLTDYAAARCKADRRLLGNALLFLGRVTRPDAVAALDADITYGAPGHDPMFHFRSDKDGVFALCLGQAQRRDTIEIRARGQGGAEGRFVGVVATGLTPVRIALAGRAFPASETLVTANGIAFDSLHDRSLIGAVISLVGSTRTAITDSNGIFHLDSLVPGRYPFAMQHEVLDTIGVSGVTAWATIRDGRDTVRVSVPSFGTLWRAVCRRPVPSDSGIVFGSVRGGSAGAVQPAAKVVGTWVDVVTDTASGFTREGHIDVTADSAGGYAFCGVPTSVSIHVRAFVESGSTRIIELPPLNKERLSRRDLVLGSLESDSTSRGVLEGLVTRDSSSVANARVLADGVREVRTGTDGRFTIRDVPTGTRQVDVRAIGLLPTTVVFNVMRGDTAHINVRMSSVTALDSVRVVALAARQLLVTQFEARRKLGVGLFKDSTQLAKSNTLTNVFAGMPVTMRTGRGGVPTFEMLGCVRTRVWIDRARADPFELATLRPDNLAAVEVYGAGLTPPELRDAGDVSNISSSMCSIVIWTKRSWP